MTGAIVGREAELGAVGRFLDRVALGPAALVIEGEAGIGKTTVWQEAIAAAEARSFKVLRAQPTEPEATLSYGALADLVGVVFEETRAVLPAPQDRALAAALLLADLEEPADPRTTATALVGVLTALAAEQPVLVAVDDVQWLDPASERALGFAARRLPSRLGLLLTLRAEAGGAVPFELDRALAEDRLERVAPGPLSLAALHHLLSGRLGMSLARPTLARLAAASGGNPFFALEIGRALARAGDERTFDDPLPVPSALQELVASRVRALSTTAKEVVLVAAMLSRPTVATVARALVPRGTADAALAEAEEAGVLVAERGRIRFTHPLLASAIYASVSREQRRQLHHRLAEVVGDREERARHLALSTDEVDEAIAAELEQAARQASLKGAQDAAADIFEAACRLTPPDQPDGLARRLLGQAAALLAVGGRVAARPLAEQALATPAAPPLRAEALICLASIDWSEGSASDANHHLEQALKTLSDDHQLRGRIYMSLARFNVLREPKRAVEQAKAALQLLSEEREPELVASALIDRFFAETVLGRPSRRELFERGLELEARAGVADKHPIPLLWFHFTDDFDAARARFAEEDELCRERGWESCASGPIGPSRARRAPRRAVGAGRAVHRAGLQRARSVRGTRPCSDAVRVPLAGRRSLRQDRSRPRHAAPPDRAVRGGGTGVVDGYVAFHARLRGVRRRPRRSRGSGADADAGADRVDWRQRKLRSIGASPSTSSRCSPSVSSNARGPSSSGSNSAAARSPSLDLDDAAASARAPARGRGRHGRRAR